MRLKRAEVDDKESGQKMPLLGEQEEKQILKKLETKENQQKVRLQGTFEQTRVSREGLEHFIQSKK